ncbi:unnamed protein product, partial [Ectocarpus sp. 8 AP-2014]
MRDAPGNAGGPADPSRASEMDNASFVATLPPELRREVLLSADDALLSTLPPNLVAEAMVMRERIPHQVCVRSAQAAQAAGYASGVRAGAAAAAAAGGSGGGGGGGGSAARGSSGAQTGSRGGGATSVASAA